MSSLADKVIAFEKAYERAGVKHYPSRQEWARIAQKAWQDARKGAPAPLVPPAAEAAPRSPEKLSTSKRFWTWATSGMASAGMLLDQLGWASLDYRVQLALLGLVVILALYAIGAMPRTRQLLRRLSGGET